MNVTLTSLEALILKATHESLPCPDAAALEAFCTIMRNSSEGPQLAAQALACRIHSPNSREALLALLMIDRCMRRCDSNFHAEIGKFRFLNEMIKLVSPKYFADRTAAEVRTRVLQLLHAWSIEYPKETKFKVAYEMLRNQGVVKETPPPLPPEDSSAQLTRHRAKSAIFEDEERSKLLQKLLQSKKQEDLQHANLLIKTMVREEERRTEANSVCAQDVSAALDSAGVLSDLLSHASEASSDELQLMCELNSICIKLRIVLQDLAATNVDDNLSDVLYAIDVLNDVCAKYKVVANERLRMVKALHAKAAPQAAKTDSLLDFVGENVVKNDKKNPEPEKPKPNAIDELGDIFSAGTNADIAEPLKPVNVLPNVDTEPIKNKTNKAEGWVELDSLGEQLMKQSLPEPAKRIDNFNNKPAKKIPMNTLASPKHEAQPLSNGALLDLDFFTRKPDEDAELIAVPQQAKAPPLDGIIVDITDDPSHSNRNESNNNISENNFNNILDLEIENTKHDVTPANKELKSTNDARNKDVIDDSGHVKPLGDINVSLHNVQPSKVPPVTVFEEENGITVVLHFCQDKPRPDVNVIVISTTSKNKSPIHEYKFQSILPKGSKCRIQLLSPSGTSLPPYNPFLPPPALTQVMLVARPLSLTHIDMRFVLTYSCGDEMCSELGEIKQLPLIDEM